MVGSLLASPAARRGTAAAALAALALLLIAAIFYKPPAASARDEIDYGRLPQLFVEAAAHLNRSSLATASALTACVDVGGLPEEAESVARELALLAGRLALEEGELPAKLSRSARAYAAAANASAKAYRAASLLSGSRRAIDELLSAILRCDARAMASAWLALRGNATRAAKLLSDALVELAAANPGDLASDEHRRLLDEASERLSRALKALRQLAAAGELALKHADEIAQLCRAAREGRAASPSPGLAGDAGGLKSGEAGPYSYPISRLAKLISGGGQWQPGAGGPGAGSGAGYGEPPSDD